MKVKEGSENGGLKLNTQKTKIMASSPITWWQTDGESVETVTDFIFLVSKITVDGAAMKLKDACSFEGKIWPNLDSILKSRDITLPINVHLVKTMVFSSHVWIWELNHKKSWALKNWCFWTVML